jgi:hypothetical protein
MPVLTYNAEPSLRENLELKAELAALKQQVNEQALKYAELLKKSKASAVDKAQEIMSEFSVG